MLAERKWNPCVFRNYNAKRVRSRRTVRRLASGLLPLLPRIGKAVASTALGVVSDKMRGVPLSEALKKRGLEAGKKLLFNRKPAKRKKTVKRRTRTVNKRIRKSDVFGSI